MNTAKSEMVHFRSKSVSPLQNPFTYRTMVWCLLPEKDRFKYLGMLLDRRMNPKIAEEHAVRPYIAAQSRISEFAKSHDLKKAGLMLCSGCLRCMVFLLGCMPVRCAWGTVYLSEGSEFGSQLQKRHRVP